MVNEIFIYRILDEKVLKPTFIYKTNELDLIINKIKRIKFDFIHCHDYHMLFLGYKLNKILKTKKLIYDSHELLSGYPIYKSSPKLYNKFKGYFVWIYQVYLEKKNTF